MFTEPHWLVLIFPALFALFYYAKSQNRIMFCLRLLLVVSIFLAISGLQIPIKTNEGTTILLADRSLSMPDSIEGDVSEAYRILMDTKPENAKFGLISFGANANVELAPTGSSFSGLSNSINPQASNLSLGLQRAISLIPTNHVGKILILSDGEYTGENPEKIAIKAAERGIKIDFRHYGRNRGMDTYVSFFGVPNVLNPNEYFIVNSGIYSPVNQKATIKLFQNGKIAASFEKDLRIGNNDLAFSLKAPEKGVIKYELQVLASLKDDVTENDKATAIAEINSVKPVLIISDNDDCLLKPILKNAGVNAEIKSPTGINWSLEFLTSYSALIVDNVSAGRLTYQGMRLISSWVKYMGGGFMLVGGNNSYGVGGYHQSPLDDILPVSMEMRSERRKMKLALMIALDRSGSMSAGAGGRTKMDLANLGASAAFRSLMKDDEFGLIAVDTEPNDVIPMHRLNGNIDEIDKKILSVESMGGGIYVYKALETSLKYLSDSQARLKHIILFADASDSEQPGEYWELLNRATAAGITVSVIGLGREKDCDAELLKKIADAGKGRIFFTNEPRELPRIFMQDTYIAAKSSYADKQTDLVGHREWLDISPLEGNFPSGIFVNEYNICFDKAGSKKLISTNDDDRTPILSYWRHGLGYVAGLMAPIENNEKFISNKDISELIVSLCKKLINDDRMLLNGMTVNQRIVNGVYQANLYLDPEREKELFERDPELTLIRVEGNKEPVTEKLKMRRESADAYIAETQLYGNEVVSGIIVSNGAKKTLPPICQIYSSEFAFPFDKQSEKNGLSCLRKLSAITGGDEINLLNDVWSSMPVLVKMKPITLELLMFSLILFFLEISERRLSLLSLLWLKLSKKGVSINRKSSEEPGSNVKIEKQESLHERIAEELNEKKSGKDEIGKAELPENDLLAALKHMKKRKGNNNNR